MAFSDLFINEHLSRGVRRGYFPSDTAPSIPDDVAPRGRDAGFWMRILAVVIVPITVAWLLGRRRAAPASEVAQAEAVPIPRALQAKFVAKRQTILAFLSADTQQLV